MGKSSAPPAPDYAGAAEATAQGNLENQRIATTANRVNTYTPYGSLTYSQDPTNQDKWSSNVSLSPDQQGLLDQQNRTSMGLAGLQDAGVQRVAGQFGQGFDQSTLPGAGQVYNPNQDTNDATQRIMARLEPQFQRQQSAMDTQLANQGITRGSEAYINAQDQFGRDRNDAYSQAALQGINLGMGQQAQQFGQAQTGRQQGIQEQAYLRSLPLNELNALRTGAQVTNPTFSNAPQQGETAGPDYSGAMSNTYNAQMQGVNADNANSGQMMNGLFGMGSAAVMAF